MASNWVRAALYRRAGVFLVGGMLTALPILQNCSSSPLQGGKGQSTESPAEAQAKALLIVPGLDEPLVRTKATTEKEDGAVKAAADSFRSLSADEQAGSIAALAPWEAFVSAHPGSGWTPAVETNLGLAYYRAGYFSRAFAALEAAWEKGKASTDAHARPLVDRALGELAKMHARVGHADALEALFKDMGARKVTGSATELIVGAREGFTQMRKNHGIAYLCGPKALQSVARTLGMGEAAQRLDAARSGEHGFSLSEVSGLADDAGMAHRLVYRTPGQEVPVPSVVNWKVNHYAAIVARTEDGRYRIQDPTFGRGELMVTREALDEEATGYFLVPEAKDSGALNGALAAARLAASPAWRGVTSEEAGRVYGMGYTYVNDPDSTSPQDTKTSDADPAPGGLTPEHPTDGGSCPVPPQAPAPQGSPDPTLGMCQPSAHAMTVSLNLNDTPVGYRTNVGPNVFMRLSYSQREANQPGSFSFFNVGPKWTLNALSYITDIPNSAGTSVTRYVSGGGKVTYSGYSSGTFSPEMKTGAVLTRSPSSGTLTSYTLTQNDGSTLVYSQVDGASGSSPRRVFLTSITDSNGNALTLAYDGSLRLTTITDAVGRVTSFCYDPGRSNCGGYSGSSLLVSRITDPFGRYADLDYSSGKLSTITDVLGIQSSFHYDGSGLVDQLTTPYGTTNFAYGETTSGGYVVSRYLETTDPLSHTERLEFSETSGVADSEASVPSGMTTYNGYLTYRNSFFWDKNIYAAYGTGAGKDYTKARRWHWLHTGGSNTSPILDSVKQPLENRVWYTTVGQGSTLYEGTSAAVTAAGRVLDDATSQVTTATYNSLGKVLTLTDPLGRVTVFTYAGNNIDLTKVEQKISSTPTYATLAQYTHDGNHNVLTKTDAAGQVWRYCYNAAGQLTQAIDPANYVSGSACTGGSAYGAVGTRFTYDGSGRLTTITDALGNTYADFTYSGTCGGGSHINCDIPSGGTNPDGTTWTQTTDALDRVTVHTYQDGTTDSYNYTGAGGNHKDLDLLSFTDRAGKVTSYAYDANRRLTTVTDPLSHTTQYAYQNNGQLFTLTDQNSNVTKWSLCNASTCDNSDANHTANVQSRVLRKYYANSKKDIYTYETTTSRLKTVTDGRSQVRTLAYDKANAVTGITYTSEVEVTPDVTFTYDAWFPRRTGMTDGNGSTSWTYKAVASNGALQVDTEDGPFTNDSVVYAYDVDGRANSMTVGGTSAETWTFDALGRVATHGTLLGTFTVSGYRGETGLPTGRSLGSSSVTWGWTYDSATSLLTNIATANTQARKFAITYPTLGGGQKNPYRMSRIAESAGDTSGHPWAASLKDWDYTYDSLDRLLTQAPHGSGATYTYAFDNAGNATTFYNVSGTSSPSYNSVNQLTGKSGETYIYYNDGAFEETGGALWFNTWRADGTPEFIYEHTSPTDYVQTEYTHDGLGRVVKRDYWDGVHGVGEVTYYGWCGSRLCSKRNSSQTVLKRYYDEGEYTVSGTVKRLYVKDQVGSVRDVIDTSGSVQYSADYSPYGEISRETGSGKTDFLFAGLYNDPHMSVYFSQTRVYDPKLGRWWIRDPIAESGGINVYEYAGGNPVMRSDPSGLCPEDPWYKRVDWHSVIVNNPGYTAGEFLLPFFAGGGIGRGIAYVARGSYVRDVEALSELVSEMRAAGGSAEEIARVVSAQRRAIGAAYKNWTPPKQLAAIIERNVQKYGDELGPTIDWLRSQGRTWEEIIESATRTGGKDLGY